MSLVMCAVTACICGFDLDSKTGSRKEHLLSAPRQTDFVNSPCAERSKIITAAMWLREILAPEWAVSMGENVFETPAEIEECLDGLLNDGVLTYCIPLTKKDLKQPSVSSSQASMTQGSQRKSVDRVVDKSAFIL